MTAQEEFEQASKWLDLLEGFKSDDSNDRGGLTIWGHTQGDLDEYCDLKMLPRKPISDLTETDKQAIRMELYWLPMKCHLLGLPLSWLLFQWGFLQRGAAPRGLQKVVGCQQDGAIGNVTIAAVKDCGNAAVSSLLLDEMVQHLRELVERSNQRMVAWLAQKPGRQVKTYDDDQREFMLGWVNRASKAAYLCGHDWIVQPWQLAWAKEQDADFEAGNPPTLT